MRKFENGRSMIEMLGVLAIIGVLSIGGLSAYKRAISTYRANEALNYVETVYAEVVFRDHYIVNEENENLGVPCSEFMDGREMELFYYCGGNRADFSHVGLGLIGSVSYTFEEGAQNVAAALEHRLGLPNRDGVAFDARYFIKRECYGNKTKECHFGYSPCVAPNETCTDEYNVPNPFSG